MEAGRGFDREKSLMLKGIAICMLLLHHSFGVSGYYRGYTVSFYPFAESQVLNFSIALKICVSIYAFISGYGLYLSYDRYSGKGTATRWCAKRYIRTFSAFWFIWVLTAIIRQAAEGYLGQLYMKDGGHNAFAYIVIDFLGLGQLFQTPKLIGHAWYMSAAAVFMLLAPLVYRLRDELGYMLALHVVFLRVLCKLPVEEVFPGRTSIYAFITPFMLGCMFARYGWFERWLAIGSGKRWAKAYKCAVEAWLVIFGYKLYHNLPIEKFWDYHYGLYALMVILFCVEFVIAIPGLQAVLRFMGRHSTNIFLTHFALLHYFRPVIMGRGHFALCVLTLTAMSVAASIAVEGLKKLVRYQRFVGWLEARI